MLGNGAQGIGYVLSTAQGIKALQAKVRRRSMCRPTLQTLGVGGQNQRLMCVVQACAIVGGGQSWVPGIHIVHGMRHQMKAPSCLY